ncbi:MAG: NAD(P)-dependent oxidoreductase [Candidatus Bathyarchaeia archaeon]|jgi:nucleoside-diphosphate-sugar epimerase
MILITGGAGRLGFEVVKLLVAQGEKVRVFDLPNINWSHLEALSSVTTFKGDITNSDHVHHACEGARGVIHLAALMPPRSEADESLTHMVNVVGTINLLKNIEKGTPVVFSSSISVYGVTPGERKPIDELHSLTPHDSYSKTKILGEKIVSKSGNPYTILRISPIAVADLVELPSIIPYRADQRVEFIFVEDAARAIVGALQLVGEKETFNVAGGDSWQMLGHQYIEGFYEALGVEVDPKYSEEFTAVHWYDTSKGRRIKYQSTSFELFEERLKAIGDEYGLR